MDTKKYQWTVVGAGPAGIAAVGKLLDEGVSPNTILWIDPNFQVGDLGALWAHVSSNTTVRLFIDFLNGIKAFSYSNAPIDFLINHLPPEDTCTLQAVVEPLQWITECLRQIIDTKETLVTHMALSAREWILSSHVEDVHTYNVILATGAIPTVLHYPDVETVPLDIALDFNRLKDSIQPHETYAVVGSSHSAIIVINHLISLDVKQVVNFYRSPCRYAVNMGDWILFDNTGLKGQTAAWAREHIDGTWPTRLVRYQSHEANLMRFLPTCDKVVYATGFESRMSITILDYEHHEYNPHVGIIGPGLFGFGIGYPEVKPDPYGSIETQVGLWKFLTYLNKVMPIWFKYPT